MTVDLAPAFATPFDGIDAAAVADAGPMTRGKVRDIVDLGDTLALIATDRISAFDRVLGTVPYRGQVLNELAAWWFERIADIVAAIYQGLDPRLRGAAGLSVFAHLEDLVGRGLASCDGAPRLDGTYAPA